MTRRPSFRITAEQVSAYLGKSGWILAGEGRVASVWRREGSPNLEVVVPRDTALKDYEDRVSDALHRIASYEGREVDSLVSELSDVAHNMMAVRVIGSDTADGRIPLRDGLLLIEKARSLFSAAAMAVHSKRNHFIGPPSIDVREYTDSLLLGQTEIGSYIVKVIAPVDSIEGVHQDAELGEESFGGAVIHRLVTGMTHLVAATSRYKEHNETRLFDLAVAQGASANMCDALLGFSGVNRNRSFEIKVAGSADGWFPAGTYIFSFNGDDVNALEFASSYYRNDYVLQDREIVGSVKNLRRKVTDEVGTITVQAMVGDIERSVRIQLGAEEYHAGVMAHDKKLIVRCRGDVHVKGKSTRLLNPTDFLVIDTQSLF